MVKNKNFFYNDNFLPYIIYVTINSCMKFKYYFCFFSLMSFPNKVNAMEIEEKDFFHLCEQPPTLGDFSCVNIFELCYIGISFIYAGYKTIRILFVDKNFNDNKLYLITNITNLLGGVLILFGFFLPYRESLRRILCSIGVTCTLVSSISSIINLIIQEEFKKNLTSSILGCLGCVIGLFFSFIVIKQIGHL